MMASNTCVILMRNVLGIEFKPAVSERTQGLNQNAVTEQIGSARKFVCIFFEFNCDKQIDKKALVEENACKMNISFNWRKRRFTLTSI